MEICDQRRAAPGRFTPGNEPVPTVQDAGWISVPVCTGVENLTRPGFRSPDRAASGESLYRLAEVIICWFLYQVVR